MRSRILRGWSIRGLLVVVGAVANSARDLPAQTAQWIWGESRGASGPPMVWLREFTAPASVPTAQLSFAAGHCEAEVRLNGRRVASLDGYSAPCVRDVTSLLVAGRNQLELRALSTGGPSAVALRLEATAATGQEVLIVTDESWNRVTPAPAENAPPAPAETVSLGEVHEFELDPRRQFGLAPTDDYEQWRRALGDGAEPASFQIPDGFEIARVRAAQAEEGSWISLAFDPRGRLVIGREDRGLLRATLSDDGTSVQVMETIDNSLLECRGLCFAGDSLYVNANNSKAFYRLRDSNGDDRFDDVQLLKRLPGSVGHGRNDVVLGPDGYLYLMHGDSVEIPRDAVDWTSPYREHRQGKSTLEGHLLRTDLEGRRWEVLAAGLRNPYGIAFHADGEPFTYDADAEFDMGAPWYRPTQVKHLTTGSDFGWRGVTGKWPPYYPDHPDNAPPNVHIGKGSPTSIRFGYGSAFPRPYQESLFILDWAYGRIIAVRLVPWGASYLGQATHFLQGRPLNVTDLDFGPDGAMYFVTGGRKTQSALYRVRYRGTPGTAALPSPFAEAREHHARQARTRRRELETLRELPPADVLAKAWPALGESDPWLRSAARTAVERLPVETWRDRAFTESHTATRLTALLALARSGATSLYADVVRQLNVEPLDRLPPGQLAVALYTYQLCLAEGTERNATEWRTATARLNDLYPYDIDEINHSLSRLLATLGGPDVVAKTLDLLGRSRDQAEQLHYLFVLRSVSDGWTPPRRQQYAAEWKRAATFLGGQGMAGFLQQIRDDVLAASSAAERTAWAELLQTTGETEPLPVRHHVRSWTPADVAELLMPARKTPDLARGARLFREALCSRCHRVGHEGQLVGPDLTDVSRRFSRHDILLSILDPSRVVAENYRNQRVETAGGRVYVGRLVATGDFRSSSVRIVTDPLQPRQWTEVPKQDVVALTSLPASPMPAGLLDTLTHEEVQDLLAFLDGP